jgi:hypothetical protein
LSLSVNFFEDVEIFFLQISEVVLFSQLNLAAIKLFDEDVLDLVNLLEKIFLTAGSLSQKFRNCLHFNVSTHEVDILSTVLAIILIAHEGRLMAFGTDTHPSHFPPTLAL